MAPVVPPPEGRFDPITGLWTHPGGTPADPQRADLGPDREDPVILVEPVPSELASDPSSPALAPGATPAQRLRWAVVALVLVGLLAVVVASLWSSSTRPSESAAVLLNPEHVLLTHCGIDELQYGGHWYERVGGVLDDGNGNPPTGWANPAQLGRLSAMDDKQPPERVVFADDHGHHEEFTLRPDATGPKRMCD